ncbi:hypothetical protein NAT65_30315 [Achromobacter xylosoxidans]|uniref:hypothetical protein n=1 Tax=Alcaligenes xylosoxydans xylosoxydans TaxID=85698 RepID=UPI002041DB31|nr:hypothetical protein [Achromobacter xylosoxidans]MCM2575403.1 hypothetical protein [Achromobacter xylosoxidans]
MSGLLLWFAASADCAQAWAPRHNGAQAPIKARKPGRPLVLPANNIVPMLRSPLKVHRAKTNSLLVPPIYSALAE